MTIYNVHAEVATNIAPEKLFYDMALYKQDWNGNKTYALKLTGIQQLQANKKTQRHTSLDISDSSETSYILSLNLYRKVGTDCIKMTEEPMTAIIPLKGFTTTRKKWGVSRKFEYYESGEQTQEIENNQINTDLLAISNKIGMFEAKEHGRGDPFDPFSRQRIEDELKVRMSRPALSHEQIIGLPNKDIRRRVLSYPFQNRSMFCGPAAFFYCLQQDRPDIYQQLIKELWASGKTKVGTLKISANKCVRHPKKFFSDEGNYSKISAIDWMSMASLRDITNSLFCSINSPSSGFLKWNWFLAITLPIGLKKWFRQVGATKKLNNISLVHSSLEEVLALNSYVSDHHVVSLIRSGMLTRGANTAFKSHWIVWADQVKLLNGNPITSSTSLSEIVQLKLFSWGEVYEQLDLNLTLEQFLKHTFGGLVFTKIP